jgi:Domain of unknown function (DUF1707)/Cell wall-active antibiotics response 4TMS YvqF
MLRGHLLAGRLTLDEFSERVELVLGARVGRDLVNVGADLPDLPAPAPAPTRRKPSRLTVAVFGHAVKRGRVRLRRRSAVFSIFSDVDLDLRDAEMDDPRPVVNVLALLGNVDVYVPDTLGVDLGGLTVFGRQRDWGQETGRPTAPKVQVRSLSLFGTVDVWRVPDDLQGSYGKIARSLRRRQRRLLR